MRIKGTSARFDSQSIFETQYRKTSIDHQDFTAMFCVILALFCTTVFQICSAQSYTYTCLPNNTISISGLPTTLSSMNYFAIQSDGTNCTTTGNSAGGTAEINGCSKDSPIYFTFSTFSSMLTKQIQGGKDVQILNITCYEISGSGVVDSIANNLTASIVFDEEREMNVTYGVTSSLNTSSANVGDPVEWTIVFPLNYTLEITLCTAYPGTTTSSANSLQLISAWCSSETELITNFDTNAANTEASAIIQAFKFYNNDNVYLECDVKVCPSNDSTCATTCASRRKRSSLTDDDTGLYKTSVARVLHINVPDTSSAAQLSGMGLLLMSFLTTLVVSTVNSQDSITTIVWT